jgi:hypothetical protein
MKKLGFQNTSTILKQKKQKREHQTFSFPDIRKDRQPFYLLLKKELNN